MTNKYSSTLEFSKKATLLEGIMHLLDWDHETYMPEQASGIRGDQRKLLAALLHETKTNDTYKSLLNSQIDLKTGGFKEKHLSQESQDLLIVLRRDLLREEKLPASFVEELARITSESLSLWKQAKNTNDFSIFAPILEKIVYMQRQKAGFIGYSDHPYDALIDEYSPGTTTAVVDSVFSDVKKTLVELLPKVKKTSFPRDYPADHTIQYRIALDLMKKIGFDFTRGRLDLAVHPFSSSYHPNDSRMTTRTNNGIIDQVMTILHESGHSFYDMGLPQEWFGTPLAQPCSFAIHESQSRFWETRIGRSLGFWKFYYPTLQKELNLTLPLEQFFEGINQVQPSFIRTSADEVTYPLHVILRFEIEKELIEGSLEVQSIPKRWNEKMQELLGIVPPSDTLGCLQDTHWACGYFGYFPTYSLGNIYAAQMFEIFSQAYPDWEERVSQGDFTHIHQWLQSNVWNHGRRYTGMQLIHNISQKGLTALPYVNYLKKKYG